MNLDFFSCFLFVGESYILFFLFKKFDIYRNYLNPYKKIILTNYAVVNIGDNLLISQINNNLHVFSNLSLNSKILYVKPIAFFAKKELSKKVIFSNARLELFIEKNKHFISLKNVDKVFELVSTSQVFHIENDYTLNLYPKKE